MTSSCAHHDLFSSWRGASIFIELQLSQSVERRRCRHGGELITCLTCMGAAMKTCLAMRAILPSFSPVTPAAAPGCLALHGALGACQSGQALGRAGAGAPAEQRQGQRASTSRPLPPYTPCTPFARTRRQPAPGPRGASC